MKILWIAFVWPEPHSSAGGSRTMQLIDACREAGHEVRICSPCQSNVHQSRLTEQGFETARFPPNDSAIDQYLSNYKPEVVFFDRFMIEEQFSWRVKECCPNALRILDTCDLHSLRRLRQRKIEKGENPLNLLDGDLMSEDAIRELAAIYRSDLSLVVSDYELSFLQDRYQVSPSLLELCRFFYDSPNTVAPFQERSNFVVIGNFNHPPNVDSFRVLHDGLWNQIRNKVAQFGLPSPELHLYGAYPTDEILRWDDTKSGFRVKGWTPDAKNTLSAYRVNLAPLRFGAGIKGKITDGWAVGTPCVGTAIAAEGMHSGLEFGGVVATDWESFAEGAADLYCKQQLWNQAQSNGIRAIDDLFSRKSNSNKFLNNLEHLINCKQERRNNNFIGAMLWHHQHRSTEFLSRWIQAKNELALKSA